MKIKLWRVVLTILLLAAVFVVPVYAQGAEPPVDTPGAMPQLEFIAFLVTITGFFKQQFDIKGKPLLLVAFGVGLALWFLPDIQTLFPSSAYWLTRGLDFVKLFLASLGSFDVIVNVGAKIATAKISPSGKLSTSEPK